MGNEMETELKMRAEQTIQCLLDKIDKICDDARDNGGLTSEDVRTLEKAWCAITAAKPFA